MGKKAKNKTQIKKKTLNPEFNEVGCSHVYCRGKKHKYDVHRGSLKSFD